MGVQLGTHPDSPTAVGIGVSVKSGDLILNQPDCFCSSGGFVGFMERSDNTGAWLGGH